jgi:hypothetical protein
MCTSEHSLERDQRSQVAICTISHGGFSSIHFLTNELWCAINSRTAAACFQLSPGTGLPIVFLTSQDASTTDVMSFIRAFLYASSPLRNRSQHFLNGLSCVTISSALVRIHNRG